MSPFPTDIWSMRKERDGIALPVYRLSISSSPLRVSGNPSSVSSSSSLSAGCCCCCRGGGGGGPFLGTGGSVIQGSMEGVKRTSEYKCRKWENILSGGLGILLDVIIPVNANYSHRT